MRRTAVLILVSLCAGCSSTTLADPELRVSPYLALYQLRGKTKMQSPDPDTNGLQNNPYQPLRRFGHDRTREDVGVRADFGDGFGGFRADYYRLDMNTSRTGELQHGWGRLPAGDLVSVFAVMDDLRVSYVEPFATIDTKYRGEDLTFRFAAGGQLTYRDMSLDGSDDEQVDMQSAELDGHMLGFAVRARARWKDLTFDLEYAISPEDLVLGGELEDLSQDIEARLSYRLPGRDIHFFAGVRYSEFSASGDANGFRYDADLIVDGIQLGMSVTL